MIWRNAGCTVTALNVNDVLRDKRNVKVYSVQCANACLLDFERELPTKGPLTGGDWFIDATHCRIVIRFYSQNPPLADVTKRCLNNRMYEKKILQVPHVSKLTVCEVPHNNLDRSAPGTPATFILSTPSSL